MYVPLHIYICTYTWTYIYNQVSYCHHFSIECYEGTPRLVSQTIEEDETTSSVFVTGALEVCINGTWTSVCSDSVEFDDYMQTQADIVCDGLGYTSMLSLPVQITKRHVLYSSKD